MRKTVLIVIGSLIVVTILYFFIPSPAKYSTVIHVKANQNSINRVLTEKEKWQKWWEQNPFVHYSDSNFSFQHHLMSRVGLEFQSGKKIIPATITVISVTRDSSSVIAECEMPESTNPFARVKAYFDGRKIHRWMSEILSKLKAFSEKQENIYGISIRQVKVKDSTLVSIRQSFDHVPTTDEIYTLIDELKQYINSQAARETDHPMLHIDKANEQTFNMMVAIPVNGPLPAAGRIQPKRMVLGNILEAEVKGGTHTVQKLMKELEKYVQDYRRTSPAIPFESLVTDRRKEPDTTKWITRLYYPVL